MVKTDPDLSRLLEFDTDGVAAPNKSCSFEYIVIPVKKDEKKSSSSGDESTLHAPMAMDYTVTLAIVADNAFRWKVDAVIKGESLDKEEHMNDSSFNSKALEALNYEVTHLLAERLKGVYQFQSGGSSTTQAVRNDNLPRYEDVKQQLNA